jgi:hypothetical protein
MFGLNERPKNTKQEEKDTFLCFCSIFSYYFSDREEKGATFYNDERGAREGFGDTRFTLEPEKVP